MKVGIVGDAKRAMAWEKHLRPHAIVKQVDLAPSLQELQNIDACFILNDTESNLDLLLEAIQKGLNSFLICKQPTDIQKLEKVHRAAKEAGVHVQFSHWPSLAPATQWMMDKVSKPSFMHITRQVVRSHFVDLKEEFRQLWIDELGICLKWIDSGVHHIEAKEVRLDHKNPISLHLFIRFDNGSSASIFVYGGAQANAQHRLISNRNEVLDCDVPSQTIRIGRLNDGGHLFFGKQVFDPSTAAEKAALLFLKSIQINRETAYTSYDALQLAIQVQKVEQRLQQFS